MSAVTDDPTISFPDGLVGFGGPRRFVLTGWGGEGSPFSLLSSVDDDLAFVVAPPAVFFSDYDPPLAAEAEQLGLTSAADGIVLVIVTVGDDPREATANLLGPLLIDPSSRRGVQAVLTPDRYPSRRRLVEPLTTGAA